MAGGGQGTREGGDIPEIPTSQGWLGEEYLQGWAKLQNVIDGLNDALRLYDELTSVSIL